MVYLTSRPQCTGLFHLIHDLFDGNNLRKPTASQVRLIMPAIRFAKSILPSDSLRAKHFSPVREKPQEVLISEPILQCAQYP
jgi:hypothetical protein